MGGKESDRTEQPSMHICMHGADSTLERTGEVVGRVVGGPDTWSQEM